MVEANIWVAVLAVVIIFLFSVKKFSGQIKRLATKKSKNLIKKITSNPWKGTLVGAAVTSFIQSSSATTVILVGLVDAGMISFYNSLGVIFGANIGTTITAQLVAFNIMAFAPIFIILGFLIEVFGRKYKVWGRPIFYFGLIFFSLSLISAYIEPIRTDPVVISILTSITGVFTGILAGIILTIILQSSSITSGLVVVLAGTGLLTLTQSIGILFGANIGTTTTALFASMKLGKTAKKTAFANFMFNVLGVLIFLPFVIPFTNLIISLGGSPERLVANAHLIFNLTIALIFLILIKPFNYTVEKLFSKIYKK